MSIVLEFVAEISLKNIDTIRLLVVDDKEPMREVLRKFLVTEGYEVETAATAKEALTQIAHLHFDLILSDIKMPAMDGNELLDEILRFDKEAIVILMTAFGSIEAAVSAVKRGAKDYISKPFEMDEVLLRIRRALKESSLKQRVESLENQLSQQNALNKIIGNSLMIKQLRNVIERVAPLADTVLITGETGTGKELVARALHESSARKTKPFIALDCSAIPETLIESELFGHERGAFTGANESRVGLFETASDGTLFLDEVETLSLPVQAKLLRVLQEKTFRRVGGRRDSKLKARILAATNQDLLELVEAQKFRRDLYYRLAVIPINVPPLRLRREDVPEIVAFLLSKRARELNSKPFILTPQALQTLVDYEWRGNVRELENVISYITALGGNVIDAQNLPSQFHVQISSFELRASSFKTATLAEIEKNHIIQTLESVEGNRVKAAQILGVDRRTLYNKLQQYEKDDVNQV
ncbi:MAG: sigma-54-dependent Fis family transcriptional regulator [Pyrinomonadaceae bacterium]|nr:sigma-54-dependent Fis family transcriptional regulator [Pyrinomonadaceae bacterium]